MRRLFNSAGFARDRDTVGFQRLRILGLILQARQRNETLTFRTLCRQTGLCLNAITQHLQNLKRDGLIEYGFASRAAIRPLVRLAVFEDQVDKVLSRE